MILILFSFIISIPVTYLLIEKWLENFTEKITIHPSSFIVAGFSVLVIAWTTMSYLSYNAAVSNPTKALRNE